MRRGYNYVMITSMKDPRPTTDALAIAAYRLEVITAAYAPEDCEDCEMSEGTCLECAIDALEEHGFKTIIL